MKSDPKLAAIRKSMCWTKRVYKPKDHLQNEIDSYYAEQRKNKK
jgi:hypothetical protein